MTRVRRKRVSVEDPLLRACPACKAGIGEGCRLKHDACSLTAYAARLVHAARLEEMDQP